MIPDAKIPVLQLSLNSKFAPADHYEFAKVLAPLRDENVLIIGSGNLVHNLGLLDFKNINTVGYLYDWAMDFNNFLKQKIQHRDHNTLINYHSLGVEARKAIPTPEHYLPALYILSLSDEKEEFRFFNDEGVGGSLTMTSFMYG